MLTDDLDELIARHEWDAALWTVGSAGHEMRLKRAADLRAMKEEHNEALQAVRDFLHAVLPWKPCDYATRYFLKRAIAAGQTVLAMAEETKSESKETKHPGGPRSGGSARDDASNLCTAAGATESEETDA